MFQRLCPVCSQELTYKVKASFTRAVKLNIICGSCAQKTRCMRPEEKLRRSIAASSNVKDKNSFYGKKHSNKTKEQIALKVAAVTKGSDNPMFGKTFYDAWLAKYGKEIADKKLLAHKGKSALHGKANGMYGITSPQGSGNGWSGWYKGQYFRSLIELSYMVNVLDRFNIDWQTAESKDLTVYYTNYDGAERTYRADFLVAGKYLVECKPKKLHNTPSVQLKAKAATAFCKLRGLVYKLTWVSPIKQNQLADLIQTGQVKLLPTYQEKFELTHEQKTSD